MAVMKYVGSKNGTAPGRRKWCVNQNQTIVAGSIVVVNTILLDVASAQASAGTVAGVAITAITTSGSVDADDFIYVDDNPMSIYEMTYTTGSKTSLVLTDVGTKFDITGNAYTIDLDDTTSGYCLYVGDATEAADTGRPVGHFQILGNIANI